MAKTHVNGPNADPVYQLLKGPDGYDIRWNFFTKFLVRCGSEFCEVQRFDGAPRPLQLEPYILAQLESSPASDVSKPRVQSDL